MTSFEEAKTPTCLSKEVNNLFRTWQKDKPRERKILESNDMAIISYKIIYARLNGGAEIPEYGA
jgi:hypothetical protein